ncbi:hypothetical protein [Kibdelosporangium aridum]|uniref:hypothetical protein n=1 Tax=Kibdelosporangium aridum TaxID=2030 RepID=UPI000526B5C5
MTSVLIAPVTITPTKPLTASHLKGLLWVDVMYRASQLTNDDVDYRYSNTTYNTTAQTLGFWEYLDRKLGDLDFESYDEHAIGDLYVQYHADPERAPFSALRPYLRAVDDSGWVHPVSKRLIGLWRDHYVRLGMHDPGLADVQPPGMALDEMVDYLLDRDLCLDQRRIGGPVYLDVTRFGLPLRQIVTSWNQPNYLAAALRDLLPLAGRYDETVLVHDRGLTEDFEMLRRVLDAVGGHAVRVVVDRVPINGVAQSSRHGGWQSGTVATMLAECSDVEPCELRVGIRMYFLAVLGKGSAQSYDSRLVTRSVERAGRLLAQPSPRLSLPELAEYVARCRKDHCHVDPYRLTSGLLSKHRMVPVHDLVERVYSPC